MMRFAQSLAAEEQKIMGHLGNHLSGCSGCGLLGCGCCESVVAEKVSGVPQPQVMSSVCVCVYVKPHCADQLLGVESLWTGYECGLHDQPHPQKTKLNENSHPETRSGFLNHLRPSSSAEVHSNKLVEVFHLLTWLALQVHVRHVKQVNLLILTLFAYSPVNVPRWLGVISHKYSTHCASVVWQRVREVDVSATPHTWACQRR